ncbi:hypothetical protein FKM82_000567 [Ascaphus truei]
MENTIPAVSTNVVKYRDNGYIKRVGNCKSENESLTSIDLSTASEHGTGTVPTTLLPQPVTDCKIVIHPFIIYIQLCVYCCGKTPLQIQRHIKVTNSDR